MAICRRLLRIPVLRYVDDLFGVDRRGEARSLSRLPRVRARARPPLARAQAHHALSCVVRVIRCILGSASVADRKTESGCPLVILGLSISVRRDPRALLARGGGRFGARAPAGSEHGIDGPPVRREGSEVEQAHYCGAA